MFPRVLEGVRVVTVEHAVAAPLCTRYLGDLGASVVKVEPPTGDFARHYDQAVHGASAHFVWLNGGKRSIAIDLKHRRGRDVFDRLLARSDVFVCNLAPAARERLIPDATVVTSYPHLVRCYISGYGTTGPYAGRKAYDGLVQGEAGLIASTGTPAAPAKPGISVADVGAGTCALALVNAALVRRALDGRGTRIDISLFDVLTDWLSPLLVSERNGTPAPPPAGAGHATIVPYGPFPTRDGRCVNVAVQNDRQWRRLCDVVLERPELGHDPEWSTNAARTQQRHVLEPLLEDISGRLSFEELTDRLDEADVPWGHVNSVAEAAHHPQLEAQNRWQPVRLDNGGIGEILSSPLLLDSNAATPAPVPALSEHAAEIMHELDMPAVEIEACFEEGAVVPDRRRSSSCG